MNLPRFTAEVSLYNGNGRYQSTTEAIFYSGIVKPISPFDSPIYPGPPVFPCGALGGTCCHPPQSPIPNPAYAFVKCQEGLGCDITTDTCVSSCGGPGQVCCDGPETKACGWTEDGRMYCPTGLGPTGLPLREMCDMGSCDRATHRCFACGTQDGGPCCPPDAAEGVARCMSDFLECKFDSDLHESGTCRTCGSRGKPPCYWGCDQGLDLRDGQCDICGDDLQPLCDPNAKNPGCKTGLRHRNGFCSNTCGTVGYSPCDGSWCEGGLGLKNGLCVVCGAQGQQLCDGFGCNSGLTAVNGVCTLCGFYSQLPCGSVCYNSLRVSSGRCW